MFSKVFREIENSVWEVGKLWVSFPSGLFRCLKYIYISISIYLYLYIHALDSRIVISSPELFPELSIPRLHCLLASSLGYRNGISSLTGSELNSWSPLLLSPSASSPHHSPELSWWQLFSCSGRGGILDLPNPISDPSGNLLSVPFIWLFCSQSTAVTSAIIYWWLQSWSPCPSLCLPFQSILMEPQWPLPNMSGNYTPLKTFPWLPNSLSKASPYTYLKGHSLHQLPTSNSSLASPLVSVTCTWSVQAQQLPAVPGTRQAHFHTETFASALPSA